MNENLAFYLQTFDPAQPSMLSDVQKKLAMPYRIRCEAVSESLVNLEHMDRIGVMMAAGDGMQLIYTILQQASILHRESERRAAPNIFYMGEAFRLEDFQLKDHIYLCNGKYFNTTRGGMTTGLDHYKLIDAICPIWNDQLIEVEHREGQHLLLPQWVFGEDGDA